MKNREANIILENVVKRMPAKYRGNALHILKEWKIYGKTVKEIADENRLNYRYVVDVLGEFRNIGKNYNPEDFLK